MAVTVGVLSETRRRTLEALCDTFAPALEVEGESETLRAFYARSASDMSIAAQIEGLLAQTALPEEIEALGQLLDAFSAHELAELPVEDLPQEAITYAAAHDDQDLWDIVQAKLPTGTSIADRVRADELELDVVLLGEGVPFIHMGDDMLRSKSLDKNSFDSGDWFNLIDWSGQRTAWKTGLPLQGDNGAFWTLITAIFGDATTTPGPADIAAASAHFQEMLRIRKSSPLFRLRAPADVKTRVDFLNFGSQQVPGVIVMTIADGSCAGADLDPDRDGIVVVINADKASHTMTVPGADGAVLHPVQQASADPTVKTASVAGHDLTVPARTTAVFQVPESQDRSGGPPCNTR